MAKSHKSTKKSLSVIIPVFNEEKTIKEIIGKVIKQKNVKELIIVDDGSIDNTLAVIGKFKNSLKNNKYKLKIILHDENRGKGTAVRTALAYVEGDYVIIQDADLEYDPVQYDNLLAQVSSKKVVYGSRLRDDKNQKAYFITYLGNVLLTRFANLLFNIELTDSYTCYKLLPTKVAKSLKLSSSGFEVEAEITAKLAKRRIPIVEVPISYIPRSYEQGKKIKTKDAIKGILTLLRIRFSR